MARIVHGFHIIKYKYYVSFIIGGLLSLLFGIFFLEKIKIVSVTHLWLGLMVSLLRLILAYLLSLTVALIIAFFIGQNKIGDRFIPLFDLLQNLPSFALIPFFIYFFGYTNFMVIIFAASSMLWPILFYVIHSLKTARSDFNDAATIFGAVGWKRKIYYLFPLCFSAAITGSIVSFSIGWEAVIGIEIIGLSNGIGVFLNNAISSNRGAFIFGLFVLLLIVFIINRLVWMPLLKKSQQYAE